MTLKSTFSFLPDGGQTGALLRSIDWAGHPLGPPEGWPSSLRTTLGIIFASRHPMFLWWGPELYQFYNDAYLPSLGRGKHPVAMGQRGIECWPEIWPIIWPQIRDVLHEGKASWNVNQLVPIFRNGTIEDVYWTYGYSAIFDDTGKVAGVLVVCTETTAQVTAIQELQASQQALLRSDMELRKAREELHAFLMQAPVGFAILSGPTHVYSLVNPMFMSLLFGARPAADLLGKPVARALPEIQGQGYFEILDEVYRTGKPFTGAKQFLSVVQGDGVAKDLYINFTYQAKRDEAGHIDGILAVVYEVTDQVNEQHEIELLAENLRAAIVSRDTFLAIASHELKTPLTALKLQTQMSTRLLDRHDAAPLHPDKIRKLVESTHTQTQRLERLVNDMLDVSQINSGKLRITLEETDLSALVQEVLERFAPQMEAAGCSLSSDIASGVCTPLDGTKIEQVVTNLVSNAIKYAPGGRIEVAVHNTGPTAKVSFSDDGKGIPPEDLERIFGRFERATPVNEVSGLGLGLFICRQIIHEHRGKIYAESEVGRGATFCFELPLSN